MQDFHFEEMFLKFLNLWVKMCMQNVKMLFAAYKICEEMSNFDEFYHHFIQNSTLKLMFVYD